MRSATPALALAVALTAAPLAACDATAPTTTSPDAAVTPDGDPGDDGPGKDDVPGGKPDGGGGPNQAPELERIGDRIVAVGEPLVIIVNASDADGDELSYSVYGSLPPGARFVKQERRFEWTPEAAGETVFLTFVVSDGRDFDRETVRIEVVAEKQNHPPVFDPVGAQKLTAGAAFSLTVKATDPDGDPLTYGYEGKLPKGASLDDVKGLFQWTPTAADTAAPWRVTFTVSDSELSAKLDVTLVVTDAGSSGAEPPVFDAIPKQTVKVGSTLTLALSATDPNGDPLTFAIYSGAPPGAALDGATFTFTAAAAQAGQAFATTFSVSDGTFTAYATAEITVEKPAATATCTDDPGEPNESVAAATPLTPGTLEASICDTALVPIDTDYYKLPLEAGQTVSASITFDPTDGDLDLFAADAAGKILKSSQTLAATEALTWQAPAATTVYLIVTGVGQEAFHMAYTLTTAVTTASDACVDDALEPNDTKATAKPLPAASDTLVLCAGTVDLYKVPLACGESLTAVLDTGGTADLDIGLYADPDKSDPPLAHAATINDIETLTLQKAPAAATYYLGVVGYPPGEAEGLYSLEATTANACQDDAHAGNTSAAKAKSLAVADGAATNLALCCADDWFTLTLAAGDHLTVDVSPSTGTTGLAVYEPSGTVQLAAQAPSAAGAIAEVTAATAGAYVLKVSGATGTKYALEWLVEGAAPSGCTAKSCPKYEVCDPDSGECVSDYCFADSDCPSGHLCLDTYCANACAAAADCRAGLGYTCKAFPEGQRCGISGSSGAGAACSNHTACSGNAACMYQDSNGYCAAANCAELELSCPGGTACIFDFGISLCAVTCQSDSDCREGDGYACLPAEEDVCLPL